MRIIEKLRRSNGGEDVAQVFEPDPAYITASTPKVLWIELTSKCPYDCIFCTRKARFGNGRHLDFEIYRSVLRELESPLFIGLNYSGESTYYPRLLEAIDLAAATGAATELVTAFSSISPAVLRGIAESRLDRLAISLHTLDDKQYQEIYQFSSLDLLQRRVAEFLALRSAKGSLSPRLDFCFVALGRNLPQLPRVAAYARTLGVQEIFIHPIIGRHLIPDKFPEELRGERLVEGFKSELRDTVDAVRAEFPDITLTILNADLERHPALSHVPRYFGPPLPEGARIHSCDQNPWETVHILAGGDVVVCEVHDEVSLGNLHSSTLREIWHGERYRKFRREYSAGLIPQCRNCPWKVAYVPSKWESRIHLGDGPSPQLLRGWYAEENGGIVWSKKEAVAVLKNIPQASRIRIAGILPQSCATGSANVLDVECNGERLGRIANSSGSPLSFDRSFEIPRKETGTFHLRFTTQHVFRPVLAGLNRDTRDLGFGLSILEVLPAAECSRLSRWF